MTEQSTLERLALEELAIRAAYENFRSFFLAFEPSTNYQYGRHTLALLDALDGIQHDLEAGRSRYLIVNIPPRHGKSDQTSRRFPPWVLIRQPTWEVILASYNYTIATEMSIDARRCFREAAPIWHQGISEERSQAGGWQTTKGGALYATGITGSITGRGCSVLVIDDYLRSREDAESEIVREGTWAAFQSDLMTRLAPVHAVVIVANRWHEDDLVGRIELKNNPNSDAYDSDFPRFEVMKFPAISQQDEWLFLERFDETWYRAQRATLSAYAWQSQFMQEPRPRTGNLFRVDKVQIVDAMPRWIQHWTRGWDLASTAKQRMKDDPDFTCGTKATIESDTLYVDDVIRGQWAAPERDAIMRRAAQSDGPGCRVKVESVAGYKDTVSRVRSDLQGLAIVESYNPKGDKVARASFLEPLFEASKVIIRRGPWNQKWLAEFAAFPAGRHDDQVDSLVTGMYDMAVKRQEFHRQTGYKIGAK